MPFSHWIMHNDSEFSLCVQNVSQVKCGTMAVLWTVIIDDNIAGCWELNTVNEMVLVGGRVVVG